MRKFILAILIDVLLAVAHAMPAAAQTAGDSKLAGLRQEHPELAFLFFDSFVSKDGERQCRPSLFLTSNTGKHVEVSAGTGIFSGLGTGIGGIAALEPAVWTVRSLKCYKQDFNGAVAQVRLEPGDVVNVGYLIVDVYTIRPPGFFERAIRSARVKVEDLEPATVDSFMKKVPETFAKAKRKYFAVNSKLKWVDPPPAAPAKK